VGKHYVWVAAPTGSQIAGSWLEVPDNPRKMPVGMKERLDWGGNAAVRQIQANSGQNGNGM
jgi:hypothetical protein